MVKEGVRTNAKPDLPDRTFDFAGQVVGLCRALDQAPGVSRTLANQLLRAGTSIGANVEEAQAAQSRADFVAKSYIACKEARETHYWLRLLAAVGVVPPERLVSLTSEANELIAILTTIVKNARKNGRSVDVE